MQPNACTAPPKHQLYLRHKPIYEKHRCPGTHLEVLEKQTQLLERLGCRLCNVLVGLAEHGISLQLGQQRKGLSLLIHIRADTICNLCMQGIMNRQTGDRAAVLVSIRVIITAGLRCFTLTISSLTSSQGVLSSLSIALQIGLNSFAGTPQAPMRASYSSTHTPDELSA